MHIGNESGLTPSRWFDWGRHAREHPDGCYVGKIYALYGDRPTVASRRLLAFRSDCWLAMDYAEQRRKQGTAFVLDELPALVITSRKLSVAVCEELPMFPLIVHEPFRRHESVIGRRKTIAGIAQYFDERYGVSCLVCQANCIEPARLPFRTWNSLPRGNNQRLEWLPSSRKLKMKHMTQLVAKTFMLLSRRWSVDQSG